MQEVSELWYSRKGTTVRAQIPEGKSWLCGLLSRIEPQSSHTPNKCWRKCCLCHWEGCEVAYLTLCHPFHPALLLLSLLWNWVLTLLTCLFLVSQPRLEASRKKNPWLWPPWAALCWAHTGMGEGHVWGLRRKPLFPSHNSYYQPNIFGHYSCRPQGREGSRTLGYPQALLGKPERGPPAQMFIMWWDFLPQLLRLSF